jgi:hypothetical protein
VIDLAEECERNGHEVAYCECDMKGCDSAAYARGRKAGIEEAAKRVEELNLRSTVGPTSFDIRALATDGGEK